MGVYVIMIVSVKNYVLLRKIGVDEVIDYYIMNFVEVLVDVDLVFDIMGGEV